MVRIRAFATAQTQERIRCIVYDFPAISPQGRAPSFTNPEKDRTMQALVYEDPGRKALGDRRKPITQASKDAVSQAADIKALGVIIEA